MDKERFFDIGMQKMKILNKMLNIEGVAGVS